MRWTALLGILLLFPGCSSGSKNGFGAYLDDRAADFCDPLRLNAGVGPGAELHLQFTHYVQLGAWVSNSWRYGMIGRESGTWFEERVSINGFYPFYGTTKKRTISGTVRDYGITQGITDIEAFNDTDRRPFEMSFNLHLAAICFEFGLDFAEFGDFLAGIFGFDPCDDDAYTPAERIERWKRTNWEVKGRYVDRAAWSIEQFSAADVFDMINVGCSNEYLRDFALGRMEDISSPEKIPFMVKMLDKLYGEKFALRMLALLEKTVEPTYSSRYPRKDLGNYLPSLQKRYAKWWDDNRYRLSYDVQNKVYAPISLKETK